MKTGSSTWGGGVLNQYFAGIAASIPYFNLGLNAAWPSPILHKMSLGLTPVKMNVTEISWMVSIPFLGHLVSSIPAGYMMDLCGRKRTVFCLSILPLLSWLMILSADSVAHLYIARFMLGVWNGVTTTIIPIYTGEIAGARLRSSLFTINSLMINLGVMYVYMVGPYVSYRNLAIACEIPTIVFVCLFIWVPESPYYLLKYNLTNDALKALSWLRKGQTKENIEKEMERIKWAIEKKKFEKARLRDIFFDKGNRKAFIIAISYTVLKRSTGSGVLQSYASTTLPQLTFGILDPDKCMIIIGFISLASSFTSTACAVKFPRRILLTFSCGGCAITMGIVMVWFYLNNQMPVAVSDYSDIIFVSFIIYHAVFSVGLGPIGTSIKGELFSVNVKALASPLISVALAITGFIVNKFYLPIAHWEGMYINYLIFTMSCIIAIIFTWTYVPDTHNKTLEDIQIILNEKEEKTISYLPSSEPHYMTAVGSHWLYSTYFVSMLKNCSQTVVQESQNQVFNAEQWVLGSNFVTNKASSQNVEHKNLDIGIIDTNSSNVKNEIIEQTTLGNVVEETKSSCNGLDHKKEHVNPNCSLENTEHHCSPNDFVNGKENSSSTDSLEDTKVIVEQNT